MINDLTIISGTGKRSSIPFSPHQSVGEFLEAVAAMLNLPMSTIRLLFSGRELKPRYKKLADFNIGQYGNFIVHLQTTTVEVVDNDDDYDDINSTANDTCGSKSSLSLSSFRGGRNSIEQVHDISGECDEDDSGSGSGSDIGPPLSVSSSSSSSSSFSQWRSAPQGDSMFQYYQAAGNNSPNVESDLIRGTVTRRNNNELCATNLPVITAPAMRSFISNSSFSFRINNVARNEEYNKSIVVDLNSDTDSDTEEVAKADDAGSGHGEVSAGGGHRVLVDLLSEDDEEEDSGEETLRPSDLLCRDSATTVTVCAPPPVPPVAHSSSTSSFSFSSSSSSYSSSSCDLRAPVFCSRLSSHSRPRESLRLKAEERKHTFQNNPSAALNSCSRKSRMLFLYSELHFPDSGKRLSPEDWLELAELGSSPSRRERVVDKCGDSENCKTSEDGCGGSGAQTMRIGAECSAAPSDIPGEDHVWMTFKVMEERLHRHSSTSSDSESNTSSSSSSHSNLLDSHFSPVNQRIFNVKIAQYTSCDCARESATSLTNCSDVSRAATGRDESPCEHIFFVMTKVLKVPRNSPLLYQRSLLQLELWTLLALHDRDSCAKYHEQYARDDEQHNDKEHCLLECRGDSSGGSDVAARTSRVICPSALVTRRKSSCSSSSNDVHLDRGRALRLQNDTDHTNHRTSECIDLTDETADVTDLGPVVRPEAEGGVSVDGGGSIASSHKNNPCSKEVYVIYDDGEGEEENESDDVLYVEKSSSTSNETKKILVDIVDDDEPVDERDVQEEEEEEDDEEECVVCFEVMSERLDDSSRPTTADIETCARCRKSLHRNCLLEWQKHSQSCPSCRNIWKMKILKRKPLVAGNVTLNLPMPVSYLYPTRSTFASQAASGRGSGSSSRVVRARPNNSLFYN